METLATAIRQNPSIKGISIGKEETKLLQYADDTTAVLSDTNSAKILFDLLNSFEYISGLQINYTKTEGMWIGSSKNSNEKPFGIKWPDEPVKALGVYFTYDQHLLKEKNFIDRLDSVKKLINIWSSRNLSIYGKITIIKSFLIPKFVYICSLLPTPKEVVKQLNQIIFKFLRNGTGNSCVNNKRIFGIFNNNDGIWKRYLRHKLQPFGGLFFMNCNYDIKDYLISSQFYHELLLWWSEFRETFASEKDWENIIWNNRDIRIDEKQFFTKINLILELFTRTIFYWTLTTDNLTASSQRQ